MNVPTLITKFRKPLGALLGAVRVAERFLGPDDDWVEDDRRIVYEAADSLLRPLNRKTVTKKGDAEYVTTAEVSTDKVEGVLHPKYQRNLLSTRKYRTTDSSGRVSDSSSDEFAAESADSATRQWAAGSWVHDPTETEWQHHVYLFPAPNGGCDIYAHKEDTVRDPAEHVNIADSGMRQVSGDPDGTVRTLLDTAGVEYHERNL